MWSSCNKPLLIHFASIFVTYLYPELFCSLLIFTYHEYDVTSLSVDFHSFDRITDRTDGIYHHHNPNNYSSET